MESKEIRNKLLAYQSEIVHYSQLQTFSRNPYEKNYYQNLIQSKTDSLSDELEGIFVQISSVQNNENNEMPEGEEELPVDVQRVFTVAELSEFDGSNGKPAYVAVNGTVYDVSDKAAWAGGTHFAGLRAGNDLSGQFASCHRGMAAMLEQLPVVGSLAAEE
ncbi:cytochrome b5 domain-containing protein [Anaerocolumna chitinilytica]|uniref:Steroid-binding protein n=1 Tax=Anaerocolumna chitinilytica TaxID=1727145 RepID=A0A7I8DHJ6_9FIRM|nr:cytochrome b5 domain-containing protein [Anaerocolumna chitinilytica]BCJ97830.1 steroid-binding protein [Anaerocolumna chitinilytica]